MCSGRTDVSNKPRRAAKVSSYPSPVLKWKCWHEHNAARCFFCYPFCVGDKDTQPGREAENAMGMQSRSVTLVVRKWACDLIRAVFRAARSEKLRFLQTAGTSPTAPLGPPDKETVEPTGTFTPVCHKGTWLLVESGASSGVTGVNQVFLNYILDIWSHCSLHISEMDRFYF